jgi:hypothetical protein
MINLSDLSVDAAQGTAPAKRIYDREGLVVVKNVLPEDVVLSVGDFLRRAVEDIDVMLRRYGFSLHDADATDRLTALMQQPSEALPESDKHLFLGHFPLEVRLAQPLRAIPQYLNTHPLLFDLLTTRRLYAHMPPVARYVIPHCSLARVPLHQDISYNRHMSDFCVVWTPLVPIDLACGGMVAYAGTQDAPELVLEQQRAAGDGWLPPIEAGAADRKGRVVLAPMDPGDLVIMSKRTMHESMPNTSDRMRLSCDFRFFGEESRSAKHYLDIAADTIVNPQAAH